MSGRSPTPVRDGQFDRAVTGKFTELNDSITSLESTSPTTDEKAALAGTSGTPSASNKYVTNADTRLIGKVFGGAFTLAAAASTTVANTNVAANSRIVFSPTNGAAANLMITASTIYVGNRVVGVSFTAYTADGGAAAGGETFDYHIYNP